jgi:hypothetical protein
MKQGLIIFIVISSEDKDMQGPFISEEKLVFGVHAHAMSQMTISKMRKIYNKVDSKSIAKQVKSVWLKQYSNYFLFMCQ